MVPGRVWVGHGRVMDGMTHRDSRHRDDGQARERVGRSPGLGIGWHIGWAHSGWAKVVSEPGQSRDRSTRHRWLRTFEKPGDRQSHATRHATRDDATEKRLESGQQIGQQIGQCIEEQLAAKLTENLPGSSRPSLAKLARRRLLLRPRSLGDKLGYPQATFTPPSIFLAHP